MKTIIKLIFVFLALLPLTSGAAYKDDYDATVVAEKLIGSASDRKEAVKKVLDNTDQADAATLFIASINAYSLGQLEDGGFLFYAAQMRAVFDVRRFKEGDSGGGVGAVFGALRYQIGEVINPQIVLSPKAYAAIVERLEKWELTTVKDYKPGWEVRMRVSEAEESSMIKEIKENALSGMRSMAQLLQDPDYFAAFRVYQDFNLATYEEQKDVGRISKKSTAEETLLRVEKQRGLFVLTDMLREKSK